MTIKIETIYSTHNGYDMDGYDEMLIISKTI